jgi:hypothetical protein
MSTQTEYPYDTSSQQTIIAGPSIWRLAPDLNDDNMAFVPLEFYCDHYMPGLDSSSSFEAQKKKPRVVREGERNCNSCSTQKTTKWYKDHSEPGKHICKKCYNQRYKERISH